MTAHVLVDGVWVDTIFPTGDIEHSSTWLVDNPSGDFEAQAQLACPRSFETSFTLPGCRFQLFSPSGLLLWGGVTGEPDRADGGITLNARGLGSTLDDYDAIENTAGGGGTNWQPTYVPNDAVDAAVARGALFFRGGNLGSEPIAANDDDAPIATVGEVLRRAALAEGRRVHVDSFGEITFAADPSLPAWIIDPGRGYMGTADDQFVTRLWGYYNKTPNLPDPDHGVTSVPAIVDAHDAEAEAQFGTRERWIDLRGLGLLVQTAAQEYIDGRFELVGGRMGWTEGVDLDATTLRALPSGMFASPRWVKAGTMLRIPGVMDARSQSTTRASVDIVLSEVRVVEQSRPTAFAAPVGFSPRDFEGALAPPENPATTEAA